jgi:cellobiose phosphorylase
MHAKKKKETENLLSYSISDNICKQNPNADPGGDSGVMVEWMGLSGDVKMSHFDTSREAFIGTYGSYKEPRAVIEGQCSDSEAFGDSACGSIQGDFTLAPGETKTLLILLGIGAGETVGKKTMQEYGSIDREELELKKLKDHWHGLLNSFKATTPDQNVDHTANVWGLYNNLITFSWSRAASLVYNGERDGLDRRRSLCGSWGWRHARFLEIRY